MKILLSIIKKFIYIALIAYLLLPYLRTFELVDKPFAALSEELKRRDQQNEREDKIKLESLSELDRAKYVEQREARKKSLHLILKYTLLFLSCLIFYFLCLKPFQKFCVKFGFSYQKFRKVQSKSTRERLRFWISGKIPDRPSATDINRDAS
jgi:hypothetical protein